MAKPTRKKHPGTHNQFLAYQNQLKRFLVPTGLIFFVSVGFWLILLVAHQSHEPLSPQLQNSSFQSDSRQKEVIFWEKIIAQYPDYPDAYLQLARLALESGETEKAIRYRQLAAQLAPNHPGLKQINLEINL